MKKLITISREFGSGGRIIGELLSKKLNVPFYDKNIIDMVAEQSGYTKELIENAELKAKNIFAYNLSASLSFSNGVGGAALSFNEKLFLAQFQVIKEIGDSGEGVIVGRCADYVLRDMAGVTNVFIYSELEDRIDRAANKYGVDKDKVKSIVADYDKARENYYNYHTDQKWGDFSNYNLAINSSYISEEAAADLIVDYVKHRRYKDENR